MTRKSALLFFLCITPLASYGQPQVIDTNWTEKKSGTWERHLGGVGGQATLTIVEHNNTVTYSVTRPCFFHPDRQYTITWKPGALIGRGTSCLDEPYRERIEPWLSLFDTRPMATR